MPNFDDFKLSIEAMSGGKNTVLFDDMEMPSVVVPFPKMKVSELIDGGTENIHPAFSVNEAEKDVMYVSKFQNIVINERAYSLPMRDPQTVVNFDAAVKYCRNKGKGWGLMPYSLWCAIALWCRKNDTMPRGNNNYGADHAQHHEKGIPIKYVDGDDTKVARIATGSGPATWNHNWMPDGIADMNGNVWEWCAGLRSKEGELHIIPYANSMDANVNLGTDSDAWKAISSEGNLVAIDSENTLKWDWASSQVHLTNKTVNFKNNEGHASKFSDMTLESELTVPELAKVLLLYPDTPKGDYGDDVHWINTTGERLVLCGGRWHHGAGAGVFDVALNDVRSYASSYVGFRSAFCNL